MNEQPNWDVGHGRQGPTGPPYRLPSPCLPQAISYDPVDIENASLHERMLLDPGRQPRRGESIAVRAVAWCCHPYGFPNPDTGWRRIEACVSLMTAGGELVRLFGWDAVADWCNIVLGADPADVANGIDVAIRTGESPAGDHWWWIIERGE